jgi:hypothetical protein
VKLEDLPTLFDRFSLCRLPPLATATPDAAGHLSARASLPAQPGVVHEHCCWLNAPRGGPPHHPLWPSISRAKRVLARSSALAATRRTSSPPACSGRPSRPERSSRGAREELERSGLAARVPKRAEEAVATALCCRRQGLRCHCPPISPRSNPQLEVRCARDAHLTVCFAQRHGARVRSGGARPRALTLSAMLAERVVGGGGVGGGGGMGAGAAATAATAQRVWRSDDAVGLLGRVGPVVAREVTH